MFVREWSRRSKTVVVIASDEVIWRRVSRKTMTLLPNLCGPLIINALEVEIE